MKLELAGPRGGGLVLLLAALGLALAWKPCAGLRTHGREARLGQSLSERDFLVSSQEVLALLRDPRVPIELFDLRDEAAFNRFHLADACRIEGVDAGPLEALPPTTVKVLISEDETRATEVYRTLALRGMTGLYVLEGGTRAWLTAFAQQSCRHAPAACDPTLALGDRHPAANPDPQLVPTGKFVAKVKLAAAGKKPSGGCGG